MVKLGELRIESNIPLIVLALSVICVVVIGFLEIKKITHRINELTMEVQNVKKEKIINEKENNEKVVMPLKSNLTEENLKKQNNQIKENMIQKNLEEQMIMKEHSQNQEEIINNEQHLQPSPEEMIMNGFGFPPMMGQGGIASVILGGGPMIQMGELHVQNMYEEDISSPNMDHLENHFEEINEDDKIVEENDLEGHISDDEIVSKDEQINTDTIIINSPMVVKNEETIDINEENDSEDDDSSIEGSESDEYSESESGSESEDEEIKLVQGKGKVEEIKEVNRSLSIKELKEICQKLGLSASGNKETLIKRINSKK
tara:strand:- start:345 stop:1292 length:948 start_codon:yes stop_codon:yes gene_type:complete